MSGGVEPAAGERADDEGLIFAMWDDVQRFLAQARVLGILVPDADETLPGKPLLVLRREANDGAALRADEIVGGDTDGPAQPRGHGDDLVGGGNRRRRPD